MPFKSEAQRKMMFAKSKEKGSGISPKMVKEWAKHTPTGKKLPEKVGKKSKRK